MAILKSKGKKKAPVNQGTELQRKFFAARNAIVNSLIERDDEVDLVMTALLCAEHVCLVGPPGVAKSFLANCIHRWMGKKVELFDIQLTKFSDPMEVFGPYDIPLLKESKFQRLGDGYLPTAHIGIVDEVWNGSSAICNTLLQIFNERKIKNGRHVINCPLLMIMGTSNRWPNDEEGHREGGAIFDRFLIRKKVKAIASKQGRDRLLWSDDSELIPVFDDSLPLTDLKDAIDEVVSMPWSDEAKEATESIIVELSKEGICPGDRRQRKSIKAVNAFAYLRCAQEVKPEHLEILSHTLWVDPTEQPEKCAKVVMKIANPTAMAVTEQLVLAEEVLKGTVPAEMVPKLKNIQKVLEKLPDDPRRDKAYDYVSGEIKRVYNQVLGINKEDE